MKIQITGRELRQAIQDYVCNTGKVKLIGHVIGAVYFTGCDNHIDDSGDVTMDIVPVNGTSTLKSSTCDDVTHINGSENSGEASSA